MWRMWMCGFLLRSINVSPFLGSLHFRLGSGARHKHLLTMRENLWTSLLFMLMLIISSTFSFIIGKEHTYEHEHTNVAWNQIHTMRFYRDPGANVKDKRGDETQTVWDASCGMIENFVLSRYDMMNQRGFSDDSLTGEIVIYKTRQSISGSICITK